MYNDNYASAIEAEVFEYLQAFQTVVMKEVEPYQYETHHAELLELYEAYWNRLTEKYYKNEPWPEPDCVEENFEQCGIELDPVFRILYTELYYRHVYATGATKGTSSEFSKLSLERYKSWENYVTFFNLIINTDEPPYWSLPARWLWDIMDEFIYQFGQFRQFRSKVQNKTADELEFMHEFGDALWGIHSVLNVMHSIVDKSKIVQSLQAYFPQGEIADEKSRQQVETDSFGHNLMYKYFGYFSLIGLLRLHVLVGDYQLAIDSIKAIPMNLLYDLEDHEWFISTHYYYCFSLMMKRSYQKAIIHLQEALSYLDRTNRKAQRLTKYKVDQQKKQVDQLYGLLAICVTMFPMKLDETIEQNMQKKAEEKFVRMQDGDEKAFEEMYNFVCPKFIPLGNPELDSNKSSCYANANTQKKVFMDEVRSQLELPAIRRYLKLYTTMELPKLSSFLSKNAGVAKTDSNTFSESSCLNSLMCAKVKMAMASGEDFDSKCPSVSKILDVKTPEANEPVDADEYGPTVDFYVDGKMVHIADTKVEGTYGRHFIKLIETYAKMEEQVKRAGKLGREDYN